MTDLKIKSRAVAGLVPYARNARTHSDEQVASLAASIEQFGWTNPVLVDGDGGILAGHGRVMAAKKLGMLEVPVIDIGWMTESQRRAYIIADNQLALNAGWDKTMLALDLASLKDSGFDMALTGFGDAEMKALIAGQGTEGLTDPDEAPEVAAHKVSQPGDVWIMGRHRIICGDSTQPEVVAKVLNGAVPLLMVTDPPYGIEYDASWRKVMTKVPDQAAKNTGKKTAGLAVGKVMNDHIADWRDAYALFPGDVAYVWHSSKKTSEVEDSLRAAGFLIRAQIIWSKHQLVIGRGDYHSKHEPCWYAERYGKRGFKHVPCWYAVRKGRTGHWVGGRKQATLWQIDKPIKSETGHSTQKPVECMRLPIINNSVAGQSVYEPFSGSGTTIIAAEMTARACYAVELSPLYVDMAVKRWQSFTGKTATLEGDGRTFNEISPPPEVKEEVPA